MTLHYQHAYLNLTLNGLQYIAMSKSIDVSVITVTWNTQDIVKQCLRHVFAQQASICYEVIVIDNGSSDDTVDVIRQTHPDARLIVNNQNRGYGPACNQGMEIANGDYILIINSDIMLDDPHLLQRIYDYARKQADVAIIGCQVKEDNHTVRMTSFAQPTLYNELCHTLGLCKLFPNSPRVAKERILWWDRKSEREVEVVSGMFMLVKRQAYQEVGGMNESFFLFYEETDWCKRFRNAGWKLRFWPGVSVIHRHGGSQSQKGDYCRFFVQFRKSKLIYFQKHYGLIACFLLRCMLLTESIFKALLMYVLACIRWITGNDPGDLARKGFAYWRTAIYCFTGVEPKSKL